MDRLSCPYDLIQDSFSFFSKASKRVWSRVEVTLPTLNLQTFLPKQ